MTVKIRVFQQGEKEKKYMSISHCDDVSNPLSTIPLNPAYVDDLNLLTFPRHIWPSCGSLKPRRSKTHTAVPEKVTSVLHFLKHLTYFQRKTDLLAAEKPTC
jgi:hypothetical protein